MMEHDYIRYGIVVCTLAIVFYYLKLGVFVPYLVILGILLICIGLFVKIAKIPGKSPRMKSLVPKLIKIPDKLPAIQSPTLKPIKTGYLVGFLCLFIFFLIFAAIVGLPITSKHPAPNPFSPSLHVGDRTGTNWFGSLKIQFQAYNSGNAPAKNVEATINVIGSEGELLTSKTIFVGNLDPGESKSFTTSIYGSYPENSKYTITLDQK